MAFHGADLDVVGDVTDPVVRPVADSERRDEGECYHAITMTTPGPPSPP